MAFVEERLPVYKEIARTDRVYYSALERIELAKAVGRCSGGSSATWA